VPLPEKYSGDEDIEQFDGWLYSLLRWLKINHFTGPECEWERIMLTAMYLGEKAKESVKTDQAAPMLCIPKKSGLLHTAIDARKRNDNTVKDVTPFLDQDQIWLDVARVKIRSKIDFSDMYEQICTVPEDVHKTAFATIYGTYVSHTMQIGDCNAPAMFQRVMTMIF
jgi:hypothetical protein